MQQPGGAAEVRKEERRGAALEEEVCRGEDLGTVVTSSTQDAKAACLAICLGDLNPESWEDKSGGLAKPYCLD